MYFDYFKIEGYTLLIEANESAITKVKLVNEAGAIKTCALIEEFKVQLKLYFEGKLKEFNIKYKINYLSWRKKLYNYIQQIKYGESEY